MAPFLAPSSLSWKGDQQCPQPGSFPSLAEIIHPITVEDRKKNAAMRRAKVGRLARHWPQRNMSRATHRVDTWKLRSDSFSATFGDHSALRGLRSCCLQKWEVQVSYPSFCPPTKLYEISIKESHRLLGVPSLETFQASPRRRTPEPKTVRDRLPIPHYAATPFMNLPAGQALQMSPASRPHPVVIQLHNAHESRRRRRHRLPAANPADPRLDLNPLIATNSVCRMLLCCWKPGEKERVSGYLAFWSAKWHVLRITAQHPTNPNLGDGLNWNVDVSPSVPNLIVPRSIPYLRMSLLPGMIQHSLRPQPSH
ncbi:hypothetical protein CSIM01_08785 [Colletotrichum simmondsii]|uniref:Uncharacterized protein n=1 Tax=Colletotrichum simmondsii TaxID=703756 RepID=A0A135T8S3_9PEZI|nr:hypothetical protein CSIM01_08785 [Colletotrichum simmondsii]